MAPTKLASSRLASGCPVVWRIRVDDESAAFDEHMSNLDEAERRRALRFHREADRVRFVVARSTLRRLLASELGV
jgi:4'-phosphopantetheinyl transferase